MFYKYLYSVILTAVFVLSLSLIEFKTMSVKAQLNEYCNGPDQRPNCREFPEGDTELQSVLNSISRLYSACEWSYHIDDDPVSYSYGLCVPDDTKPWAKQSKYVETRCIHDKGYIETRETNYTDTLGGINIGDWQYLREDPLCGRRDKESEDIAQLNQSQSLEEVKSLPEELLLKEEQNPKADKKADTANNTAQKSSNNSTPDTIPNTASNNTPKPANNTASSAPPNTAAKSGANPVFIAGAVVAGAAAGVGLPFLVGALAGDDSESGSGGSGTPSTSPTPTRVGSGGGNGNRGGGGGFALDCGDSIMAGIEGIRLAKMEDQEI